MVARLRDTGVNDDNLRDIACHKMHVSVVKIMRHELERWSTWKRQRTVDLMVYDEISCCRTVIPT